jgi:hypothetical protein
MLFVNLARPTDRGIDVDDDDRRNDSGRDEECGYGEPACFRSEAESLNYPIKLLQNLTESYRLIG